MTAWRSLLGPGRWAIAALLVAIAASLVASLAVADNVQNDVATSADGKVVSIYAGGAGALVKYGINATGGTCDASDGSSATVTPTGTPANVTKSPGSVTFTTCPNPSLGGQAVTFTASASAVPGNYPMGATVADTGGSYNTSSAQFTLRILADPTPPVITPAIAGTAGLGTPPWYTSNVDVTWTVTDPETTITSKSAACDTTTSITTDTAGQDVTCSATSAGGTTPVTVTIKRDATPPTLSPTVSPNPVAINGSATASPNADGGVSGLASSSCDPVDTSSLGANTVTCTATDNAGNTNTATASYTVYDPTPPVITPAITGTQGTSPWYTSNVDVTWTVSDPESAISSKSAACDTTTSITTDTTGQDVTCSATSAGGTTPVTVTIKRDATPPTLSPTVSPNPVAINGSATASPNADGGVSGLASSSCDPVDTSSLGANTVTCTATDNAGNTNTATASYTVIDPTPPVITPVIVGTEGLGTPPWYTSDVTVAWTVTDDESAISSKSAACDVTTTINTDTTGQTVTCTATSAGGTDTKSVTIRRDATPPTLSPTVTPNPVAINGSATASPNADGGVSGLASSSCDPVDTSSLGAQTVTCTATDNAGNTNTATASYTVIDPTPPVVTPVITGTQGTSPWYTSNVDVTWTVSDPESAISSKSAACDTTTSITTDTAGQDVTCSATSAGGTTPVTVTIKRDATPPALSPTVSPNPVAINGSATASPNADGGVSGLASSSCDPVDTSSAGTKTVTCTATDGAGNTNTGTAPYTVSSAFTFAGFFQPVDNLPTLNSVKAGSSVPVKFSLGGNFGLSIMVAGYPASKVVACSVTAPDDAVEQTSTAGNSALQYDVLTGQYTYVWKTEKSWAGTCRQLVVKLTDGTLRAANFKLK